MFTSRVQSLGAATLIVILIPLLANAQSTTPASDIARLDLDGMPLSRAISQVANISNRNCVVNWRALAAIKLTKDTRVTLHRQNTNAMSALQLLTNSPNSGAEVAGIGSVIYITSKDDRTNGKGIGYEGDLGRNELTLALVEKLRREIVQVDFDEVPLEEVVKFCEDTMGITVKIDWKSLPASKDELVTLHLKHVPCMDVFFWTMRPLAKEKQIICKKERGILSFYGK